LADGQGGLSVLRIDAVFTATLPSGTRGMLSAIFRDTNHDNRLGWKEIVVRGTASAAVRERSVPGQDVSASLRSYPDDLLQTPLEVREARFAFEPGVPDPEAGSAVTSTAARAAERTNRAVSPGVLSRFAESAARKDLTLPVVIFSLAAAVFWGALHALGPGHGKTVVAAYLVGSRGTAKHALFLGLTVTATHTAGVYLLGIITLTASHFIVPERLYPILSLASGLLVVAMGVSLLWGRLTSAFRRHAHAHAHTHAQVGSPEPALTGTSIGGGSSWPTQDHGDGHTHPHDDHDHDHDHRHMYGHDHDPGHDHDHDHRHGHHHHGLGKHSHGGWEHSHAIPGADGTPVTWRSLLMLGIYGGLIPCPTAIVVLLTSIALNRVAFGMLLVVAFSAGLALVLTGIGIALVYAGKAMERVRVPGLVTHLMPVASAAAVLIAGLLLTLRALGQAAL
jgi:ABC-type nickel/cobalt efflux system permease component RcnA